MEQTIIADALDNLRVHQRQLDMDGTEVGVSRQALNEAISYIGRLTADRDFWKERLQVETRARIEAEALSRTGAVKVKALEWEERKTRLGTVWWSAPNPLGGLSIEAASENDKIAAQADFERRILSALEPAASEGEQPVAYRIHAPEDEYYGTGPDRLQFHPLSQRDLDTGYRQTPLYTRPAEQAVTEAKPRLLDLSNLLKHAFISGRESVRGASSFHAEAWTEYDPEECPAYDRISAALTAAMEAGR